MKKYVEKAVEKLYKIFTHVEEKTEKNQSQQSFTQKYKNLQKFYRRIYTCKKEKLKIEKVFLHTLHTNY